MFADVDPTLAISARSVSKPARGAASPARQEHCRWLSGWLPAMAGLCLAMLSVARTLADDGSGSAAGWYKGNTHAHSLWSDGDELPEMVADWYKSHGYSFLAISDHDRLMKGEKWVPVDRGEGFVQASVVEKCRERFGRTWLETRDLGESRQVRLKTFEEVCAKLGDRKVFLMIPSEEISARRGEDRVHIGGLNLAEPIAPQTGQNVAETLSLNLAAVESQAVRIARPMLAQVNHPDYKDYDIGPEEMAMVPSARFFEVFNGGPVGHHFGDATHPGTEKWWDIVNTIRIAKMHAPPLYGIAADDAHNYQRFSPSEFNPGRGWIAVRTGELSVGAILDGIQHGDFYASTGVELREIAYDAKNRTLAVRVQSKPGVHYTIQFIGTLEGTDPSGRPVDSELGAQMRRPGRQYSADIGQVLMSVEADSAIYQFKGKELYVRAVVRSDKRASNPPAGNDTMETAWCQPVGWEKME